MRLPIILDTDPGIDDAAAIAAALFSPQLDLQLMTTVAGNVSVEKDDPQRAATAAFLECRCTAGARRVDAAGTSVARCRLGTWRVRHGGL